MGRLAFLKDREKKQWGFLESRWDGMGWDGMGMGWDGDGDTDRKSDRSAGLYIIY